jgi:hypothetical protein
MKFLEHRSNSQLSSTEEQFHWEIRLPSGKGKVKLSLYRPWRPLGLREVEASTFSGFRFIDGGDIVSPRRRPLFFFFFLLPRRFLLEAESTPGPECGWKD